MVWSFLNRARADRENPEELPRIAELQKDLDTLKAETRQRLNAAVESKYQVGLPYTCLVGFTMATLEIAGSARFKGQARD